MLIVSLDQYIVVVALPDTAATWVTRPQTLQSVISAYAVASVAAAAGLVLLALFILIERRSRDPLVPARLLANPVL
jgi:hypothetical protein